MKPNKHQRLSGEKRKETYSKGKILHHASNSPAHGIQILSVLALASQQVLHAAIGIDLHGAEVVEAVDQAGLLAKLLVEGIGQVVGGVGTDEQDGAAHFGELDGEGARRGGFADTTFAANEDPAERALVEERLQRRLESVFVDDEGHGCGALCRAER